MNHSFLMEYISNNLHTLVRRYSLQNEYLEKFCARASFHDMPVEKPILDFAFSSMADSLVPILVSINQHLAYGLVPTPQHYFIIGPVRFQHPVFFQTEISLKDIDVEWLDTVSECDFTDFVNYILLAYNLYQESTIKKFDLFEPNKLNVNAEFETQKTFLHLTFTNREHQKPHNPYDQEVREMASIEHGNIEALKKSIHEDYTGEVGTIAKTPIRNLKNIGIAVISLACRAAIRGGLTPEVAYSLCDAYILKIEEFNDHPSLSNIIRTAEFQYAQMVRDLLDEKEGRKNKEVNFHINRCKDYVFSHLHEKITVQAIADTLQINADYLSALFTKCEGISLTDFIQREKVNLAKNMLVYSAYSFIEIATYLGYSSQSHLGKHFKRITGFTLKKYRETYGVKNFQN